MRNKANKVVELEEAMKNWNNCSAIEAEKLDRAETEEEFQRLKRALEELQKELEEKQAEGAKLEEEIEDLQKQVDEIASSPNIQRCYNVEERNWNNVTQLLFVLVKPVTLKVLEQLTLEALL